MEALKCLGALTTLPHHVVILHLHFCIFTYHSAFHVVLSISHVLTILINNPFSSGRSTPTKPKFVKRLLIQSMIRRDWSGRKP